MAKKAKAPHIGENAPYVGDNNNNNFICIAVYTKALYRFAIQKKKKNITN